MDKRDIVNSLNESVPFCLEDSCINNFENLCLYDTTGKRKVGINSEGVCEAFSVGVNPVYSESEGKNGI